MEIIYDDTHLIVCVKERGLLSQQGPDGQKTMLTALKEMYTGEIFPVHRLDRQVGGVMVYARTGKAASELCAQVSDRRMDKIYLALVHGCPENSRGEMEDLLYFDKSKNKSFTVKKERRGVKRARLDYEVLESSSDKSLLRVRLHTGRTHQIRVQLASRRMPIFGDRRYGASDNSDILALWSHSISFIHPQTGERMTFERDADFCF